MEDGHYFDINFVQQVRTALLKMDPNLFHSKDVNLLVQQDNWFIRRFLAWRPTTLSAAIKTMVDALKWRKEININEW